MTSILLTWSGLLLVCTSVADVGRNEILPGGESPAGRFAVVWGINGRDNIDFDKVNGENGRDYLEKLTDDKHSVENYIIDLKSGAVVYTLKKTEFCPRTAGHFKLRIAWDPLERYVLVALYSKWATDTMQIVDLRSGLKPSEQDILALFYKPLDIALSANRKNTPV